MDEQLIPIEKSAVTRQAVERIKGIIVSGQFPPGSKLPPERELSNALGISRSSVREAIRALSHLNILEARHGQGTFVTSLSPELLIEPLRFVMAVDDDVIYELFEMRRIVEAGVAGLAAERITDEQIAELGRHYAALMESIDDAVVFLQHDIAMHEIIAQAAGNRLLLGLFASISSLLLESRKRTGSLAPIRAQTVIDHGEILDAVRARDRVRSAEAMRAHVSHVESKLRALTPSNRPTGEAASVSEDGANADVKKES